MPAVLEPPARTASPTPTARPTAADLVAGLTPDEKEDVLVLLLKELMRDTTDVGWIRITTEAEHLGSFLPAKGERELFELRGPKLTAEERAELQHTLANPGKAISFEEMMRSIREDARTEAERLGGSAVGETRGENPSP